MSEYINRAAVLAKLLRVPHYESDAFSTGKFFGILAAEDIVCEIPAEEVVSKKIYDQVVETCEKLREESSMRYDMWVDAEERLAELQCKQKNGKWIDIASLRGLDWWYKCSECGRTQDHTYNFCPNCGAKMKENIHE